MSNIIRLPARSEVAIADTWDLTTLYATDADWETDFKKAEAEIEKYPTFAGTLNPGTPSQGAAKILELLKFDIASDRLFDRLGTYSFLRTAEDQANSEAQARQGRLSMLGTKAAQLAAFIRPELMAIPDEQMRGILNDPLLADYKLYLERILRYKPHTLSQKEEALLAAASEVAQTASKSFRQLLDADMKFGDIEDEKGQRLELAHANFIQLLHSSKPEVRKNAFHQYYAQMKGHENTLAAMFEGSVKSDVFYAKSRGYKSARGSALFADDVPDAVYDQLISAIHKCLPKVHAYYELRRRALKLEEIHHYDCYVPILSEVDMKHTWDEACDVVDASLAPLGENYRTTLRKGLKGRWCDRYPNQNKQSGAFSSGMYDSDPFILMNFKPEVLDDVFTLTHEAGHSMHSWFSHQHQPYHYSNYTIFVAEVASTFNEQLLSEHLRKNATDEKQKAYLLNRDIDAIRSTIVRQTMFAEFEKISHDAVESGQPLTVASLKEMYGGLLKAYFGPKFTLDDELSLECLRIPHFYRAFYVYKYATGMSAAIALSRRVTTGGKKELDQYLSFLKGGCSKFPLELLRDAGVDMEKPEPVQTALDYFGQLVDELEVSLKKLGMI
jgi:oligoendopeptidase F